MCNFLKDRFLFEEEALRFFKSAIKPLDAMMPITEILLAFFIECDRKFWKDLHLPIKLPSKLLSVCLESIVNLQVVGDLGASYFEAIAQLFESLSDGSVGFLVASQISGYDPDILSNYAKITRASFKPAQF